MPEGVALSKMADWARERTMEVAVGKAGGSLRRFLAHIREKEGFTEGYYPFFLAKVADDGWGRVIGSDKNERSLLLHHGAVVIRIFMGRILDLLAIGSGDSVEMKEEVHEVSSLLLLFHAQSFAD
jgi:hypothetical protein